MTLVNKAVLLILIYGWKTPFYFISWQGCHASGEVREIEFFQGCGIVREFSEPSGKFENIGKCQGIIREI